jgi:hypothetical protein
MVCFLFMVVELRDQGERLGGGLGLGVLGVLEVTPAMILMQSST